MNKSRQRINLMHKFLARGEGNALLALWHAVHYIVDRKDDAKRANCDFNRAMDIVQGETNENRKRG